MAKLTLPYRIFYLLSRVPGLYKIMVWSRRQGVLHLRKAAASLVRGLAPASWPRLGAPKAAVSLYQLLLQKDPSVEGRIVLHKQEVTPMGPETLSARCGVRTDIYQPFPIVWTRHKNARLVTRTLGLILPPKTLAIESGYGPRGLWAEPANQYILLPAPTHLKGNYTSVISLWVPNTGVPNFSHWLLDALPRLAVLDECPPDTTVLVPAKLAAYQKESLQMLGLENRYRFTPEKHLIVENYFLSSPPSMIVCESRYSLNFLRERFLPKASLSYRGPKRFIIDRTGVTRGIQNIEEFNEFFRELGWGIIDTASLSFADEIKLFSEAEAICGAIGSGFTNAVWCQPGCAVIQLASDRVMDGSTEWICILNQLRWRYMICPSDSMQKIYVDLRAVKKILKELALL
jgi:hypothetical protein